MSTTTCPNGHPSASSDYCDTCGAPIGQSATPEANSKSGPSPAPTPSGTGSSSAPGGSISSGAGAPSTTQPCPNCALMNTADALFCEGCGYDFTTGTMPRQEAPTNPLDLSSAPIPPPAPDSEGPSTTPAVRVEWVAEVWVDPDGWGRRWSLGVRSRW